MTAPKPLSWPEYRNLVTRITDGQIGVIQIRSAWRRGLSPLACKESYLRHRAEVRHPKEVST